MKDKKENWFKRHPIISTILIIFIFLFVYESLYGYALFSDELEKKGVKLKESLEEDGYEVLDVSYFNDSNFNDSNPFYP